MDQFSDTPDEKLLLLADENNQAFASLIDRYEKKLERYIKRLGVTEEEDRKDVLQNIFIKVYQNKYRFDPKLSFNAWAYRIAHNEAISWYRKKKVKPEGNLVDNSENILPLVADVGISSLSSYDEDRLREGTAVALAQLDQKYRDVIVLYYFEYKEYEEISDILKIPIGSVGNRLHRAKAKVKALLSNNKKFEYE